MAYSANGRVFESHAHAFQKTIMVLLNAIFGYISYATQFHLIHSWKSEASVLLPLKKYIWHAFLREDEYNNYINLSNVGMLTQHTICRALLNSLSASSRALA